MSRFISRFISHLDGRFIDGVVALDVLTVDGVPGWKEEKGGKTGDGLDLWSMSRADQAADVI